MDAGGGEFEGGFMANADLDEAASTRVRAPADEQPYGDNEDTTFCFASQFTPGANCYPGGGQALPQTPSLAQR